MSLSVLSTTVIAWSESAERSLLNQLDATERLHVLATIGLLLVVGALLMLFVRAAGRVARWYMRDRKRASANAPLYELKQPENERADTWQVTDDPV